MESKTSAAPPVAPRQPPAHSSIWLLLHQELVEVKKRIDGKIGAYPPPIPACDQQFNHLLDQRRGVAGEIRRLEALRAGGGPREMPDGEALARFVRDSESLDDDSKRKIVAELQ